MNWQAYLSANPDLMSYWGSLTPEQQAQFGGDPNNFAQWHWANAGKAEGRAAPSAAPPNSADVRAQVDSGPLSYYAAQDLDTRNLLTGGQYGEEIAQNAQAYNDLNAEAGAAYGDRGQLITNQVNAWDQIAQREANDARDLVASRFGVRGDLGKSTRNIAEIGNRYAQDRALYEGDKRYAAYDDLASRRDANLGNYWSNAAQSGARKWAGYGSNYDNFAGGRAGAYSDWLNARNRQSDMGYNAAQLAVNAGQVATNNINSSTQNAADAYSNAALARGNANASMWNNVGSALGSVNWGKWGQPQTPKPTNSYGSKIYY